ncbi:MAG: hypothetical protein Q8T13_23580 [Acidobacteriota bacterium]|nr:hypothetical protein [Acidobacteriota bacterium]
MGDPTFPAKGSTILEQGLAHVAAPLSAVPPDRKGALIVGVTWRYGLPTFQFGTATRVGEHMVLAAEAEKRFRERPNAKVYAAWTWLLLLALWMPASASAQPASYPASLVRMVDADTYVLRVELGFDVSYTATIRLADLDTPERFTPEGRRATAAAEAALKSGPITVAPTGKMTFARHVAHVYVSGKKLAEILEAAGHRKR